MPSPALPESARVVVIGGGVGGMSVAYHLAEQGERDVVVVDRAELTSGSTFHSAGLVGQLRSDPTLTRMNVYSVELYRALEAGEHPVGWRESGGIKLASSPERLQEIRRQISWARTFDLTLHEISPAEAAQRFPLVDLDGVVGAAYLESDGYLDPSQLTYALAAGARANGVHVAQHTRVTGIGTDAGRVSVVRTDRGDIACEVVVNCAGLFAAEIGRLVGVRIPIVPMAHQYLITEPFRTREDPALPTLRDPDNLVYFRQEVDGLLMGGYERDPAPWTATPHSYDAVPSDFNGRLLAEDWPRFEQIAANAQRRVPVMGEVGLRRMINGPEAFTPDNEFCLGETAVPGFFVAAGFCAHGIAGAGGIGRLMAEWITQGEPSMDVSHMDISRFGQQYRSPGHTLARTVEAYRRYYDIPYPGLQREAGRPLRRSPAFEWHRRHGARFAEKSGWERVDWYDTNAGPVDGARPTGWAGRYWSPAIAAEHRATREVAGLFDESSFAKIEVTGAGAAEFLQWVCDNDVARRVGDVTYTQALNEHGGIEADFTVTRLAAGAFLIVTGTGSAAHDLAWLRRQAERRAGDDVRIGDVTGATCCYALWGPRSRDILQSVTPSDLGNEAFPYLTAQELTVGDVPARAQRVTFVGELGWEIYASSEYGATLWETLWDAGRPFGLVAGGYRAIESMRLEKGYRAWGTDLTGETTPYEAGLGFCVKLDKAFLGRAALVAAKAAGLQRRLRAIVLDDPSFVVLGAEPVRVDGQVVGRVTSGGLGYTLDASLAYAYLPVDAKPGTQVELDLFGKWVGGEVVAEPLFDPAGTRVRGTGP
ncbi:MAG: FAD-dependent oxidoreductase [Jatrophihabitans sp.]|uniref:GcvT family protein n=1 Tax=Jatrophihabitans sp. TaxID=1932789 RepID=UPI00390F7FC7